MSFADRAVIGLLSSPLRRVLSKSTTVIRYTGSVSGAVHETPVQYAAYESAIVIAVAHPGAKTWWRNFRQDHRLDLLIDGTWVAMTGLVVDPSTHPEEAAPLLTAYLARFPRSAGVLEPAGSERALVVWCRPC